jgi:hypothetical protein
MTRRFAARTFYPHTCCVGCAICRWFYLGEGKGRSLVSDKTAIGEWRSFTGEWRQKLEAWKASGDIVGLRNQALTAPDPAPASLSGTSQAAPPGSLQHTPFTAGRAHDAALNEAGIATRGAT